MTEGWLGQQLPSLHSSQGPPPPALAPGGIWGEEVLSLHFQVLQGKQRDGEGQKDGELGCLGLGGGMSGNCCLLVTL